MPIEMTLRHRTVLRGLAVAIAMIAAPALARDDASTAGPGRAWTDPPVHGSAAAPVGSGPVAPAETGAQTKNQAAERPARPARQALKARPRVRTASRPVRTTIATRRPDDRPRQIRAAASSSHPAAARGRGVRMVTLRPVPMDAYAPPPPYDGRVVMRPRPYFSGGFEDERARRIRLAREAGYVLIRARTYVLPDGRRVQSFRSDDVDD